MKKIIFSCIAALVYTLQVSANPYPSDAEDDGTKLNLWIPGFLVKMAGNIVEEHESKIHGDMLKKFGSITICIREGNKYSDKTDKKISRKIQRLDRKNYEALVKVNAEDAFVDVRIKENKKGYIKRLAVIVDETEETYVYLNMHCRIKPEDIATLVNHMDEIDF